MEFIDGEGKLESGLFRERQYSIDGHSIRAEIRRQEPEGVTKHPDRVVIYFPAWAGAKSPTIAHLTQKFADEGKNTSFTVHTVPDEILNDSLNLEARATLEFVRELKKQGQKKLIIGGHSEGAIKAVDLVALIQQEEPEVDVEGLILIAPMGLYKQNPATLAANFLKDGYFNTRAVLQKMQSEPLKNELSEEWRQVMDDVLARNVEALKHFKGKYPVALMHQAHKMAEVNPRLSAVKCPVVMFGALGDIVSSPQKIDPKRVFPNSPHAEMITASNLVGGKRRGEIDFFNESSPPDKIGHILPHWRPADIAKVGIYRLEKINAGRTQLTK